MLTNCGYIYDGCMHGKLEPAVCIPARLTAHAGAPGLLSKRHTRVSRSFKQKLFILC